LKCGSKLPLLAGGDKKYKNEKHLTAQRLSWWRRLSICSRTKRQQAAAETLALPARIIPRLIWEALVYDHIEAILNDSTNGSKWMQRDAKSVCIAVLSRDKEEERALREAISAFGADLIFAATMHDLHDILIRQPCSGLLLYLTSLVGLDYSSKSFVQTLEQVYPVARIRWKKGEGSFALIASQSRTVHTLSDFIEVCSDFAPRCLRRSERLVKTLNVLISATPDLANSTRAFTMNISEQGCFLHTPHEWNIGDSIYIQILELPSKRAIEGRVMRSVQWGVPFSPQGIGIQFVDIEDEQVEELQRLLYYLPGAHS
jgi:Tfp pilus assembly protein PilZ